MPWLHQCPALKTSSRRTRPVMIGDAVEMCSRCGEHRHKGRTVAVPAEGPPALIDPLAP